MVFASEEPNGMLKAHSKSVFFNASGDGAVFDARLFAHTDTIKHRQSILFFVLDDQRHYSFVEVDRMVRRLTARRAKRSRGTWAMLS